MKVRELKRGFNYRLRDTESHVLSDSAVLLDKRWDRETGMIYVCWGLGGGTCEVEELLDPETEIELSRESICE